MARRIAAANGEGVFVSTTPTAETVGVFNPKVKRSVLFFSRVAENNGNPFDVVGDIERNFNIAVVLFPVHSAVQDEVRRDLRTA